MATENTRAEVVGRWLGQTWRAFLRQEVAFVRWMVDRGAPPLVAKTVLWLVRLAVLVMLLYAALWLLLIVVLAISAMAVARGIGEPPNQDWFTKPNDHRDEPFYHPLSYNDDPDPRFEDD